jgi:Fur family peroxide stress response transcriptional regulator
MAPSFEELKEELKLKHINLSFQRLKVLEYLAQNHNHPTVDRIYTDLQRDISTLSRTTVYNTLRILLEAGLVRTITIEDNEVRYDIEVKDHGHFKCESCGTIYNFSVDMDSLTSKDLSRFMINDRSVYFKGICPSCLSNMNDASDGKGDMGKKQSSAC